MSNNYVYVVFDGLCEGIYTNRQDLTAKINNIKLNYPAYYEKPSIYKYKTYSEADTAYNNKKLQDALSQREISTNLITRVAYEDMPRIKDKIYCFSITKNVPTLSITYSVHDAIDPDQQKQNLTCYLQVILNNEVIVNSHVHARDLEDFNPLQSLDVLKTSCMLHLVSHAINNLFYKIYYVTDPTLITMFCLGRIYVLNSSNILYLNKQNWNILRMTMRNLNIRFVGVLN